MRALTKVGGIFFDRLDEPVSRFAAEATSGDAVSAAPALGQFWDAGVLVEPQVAGAGFDLPTGKPKIIGHMRNREYLPHLMRFAQRDPNATGQLVAVAAARSGRNSSIASPAAMNPEMLYLDGPNLFGYLGGQPRGRADPSGLLISHDPRDLVTSAVMVGVRGLRGGLENMIANYAANMEADLDWAMDWSQADNAHSRMENTWVGEAFSEGMSAGVSGALNDAFSDMTWGLWPGGDDSEEGGGGPAMAAGGPFKQAAKGVSNAVKKVPNSGGRRGSAQHIQKVADAEKRFGGFGRLIAGGSMPERLLGGTKFADLVFERNGRKIAFQIGRLTKGGLPVIRERKALEILRKSGIYEHVFFIPYQP